MNDRSGPKKRFQKPSQPHKNGSTAQNSDAEIIASMACLNRAPPRDQVHVLDPPHDMPQGLQGVPCCVRLCQPLGTFQEHPRTVQGHGANAADLEVEEVSHGM